MRIKISAITNEALKKAAQEANTHVKDDYIDEQEFSEYATKAAEVLAKKQCTQAEYTSLFGSTQAETPKKRYIKPSVVLSNKDNKYHVTYYTAEGQKMSYKTDVPMVAEVYKQMRKYIDYGITAEEQNSMTDEIYSSMGAHNYNTHHTENLGSLYNEGSYAKVSYGNQLLDDYDRLMTKYTSETSDGGSTITIKEAAKFMEIWHKWTSKVKNADISPNNTSTR